MDKGKCCFSYETSGGMCLGEFNIYQARSGHIYLVMGNSRTKLSIKQVDDLCINCYSLIDFSMEGFIRAYGVEKIEYCHHCTYYDFKPSIIGGTCWCKIGVKPLMATQLNKACEKFNKVEKKVVGCKK